MYHVAFHTRRQIRGHDVDVGVECQSMSGVTSAGGEEEQVGASAVGLFRRQTGWALGSLGEV